MTANMIPTQSIKYSLRRRLVRYWHRSIQIVALAVVTIVLGTSVAEAQELALAERGPRFLFAARPSATPKPVDVRRTPVLRHQIALDMDGATLAEALAEITRQSGLAFVYSRDVVSPESRVHLRAEQITVAAALTEILLDAGVDVLLSSGAQAALVKRTEVAAVQQGAIVGQVTDKAGRGPLVGATVTVEGTRHTTTTGDDGRYRIADVTPGTYTVRVRYIGYSPASASVTVSADQEATADFALEKSAQRLDEVVTTGTVVPTEVKALPTPISVVDVGTIDKHHPRNLGQLIREAVPTGLFVDLASVPTQTPLSFRGASSLAYGASNVKVYIDGIEAAERISTTLDPNSVERIEILRGPQASAIYGSDAIAGVMQVFTRRGELNSGGPHVAAEAQAGVVQSDYQGSGALRQQYLASVSGGSPTASYSMGGGYTHVGSWVPTYSASTPSFFGGVQFRQNGLSLGVTGRYLAPEVVEVVPDPRATATGFVPFSKPPGITSPARQQTYGVTLGYSPTSSWHNSLAVGTDRYSADSRSNLVRLTTPADTFLYVQRVTSYKTSVAYNSSLSLRVAPDISTTLTAGVDHYSAALDQFYTLGALDTTGNVRTDPAQPFVATLSGDVTNTGYFAQALVNLRDMLYVTGAIRAESNSSFGDSLGTPLSPKAGVSFVQPIGPALLKLRSSYGEGIRPPGPGLRFATRTAFQNILANPRLGPERQRGFDAGVDLNFGSSASVSVTYYNQTVKDLIQLALIDASTSPATFRRQNIAEIKNTGWELEAALRVNRVDLRAQLGVANSRVGALDPQYSGDLQIGDQVLGIPRYTAGAVVTVEPHLGTSVAAGVSVVGDRTDYDYLAEFRCFAGTGPCQSTLRDYWITYQGYTKLNLAISHDLWQSFTAFVSVDNLTNSTADESQNIVPMQGRVTLVGIRLSH